MLKENNIVLIITSCIYPSANQQSLVLRDYKKRKKQYLESLLFYINSNVFSKIVYCDNSNFDIDPAEKIKLEAEKKGILFEKFFFKGNSNAVFIKGKGYGEGEILKYVLENSVLCKKSSSFAKVTGRLIVKNIHFIVERIEKNKNYFNLDVYSDGLDTRFYICTIDMYKKTLLNIYEETEDSIGYSLEKKFYNALSENEKYIPLPHFPDFIGISGGNGRDYGKENRFRIFFWDILCQIRLFNIYRKFRHFFKFMKR